MGEGVSDVWYQVSTIQKAEGQAPHFKRSIDLGSGEDRADEGTTALCPNRRKTGGPASGV